MFVVFYVYVQCDRWSTGTEVVYKYTFTTLIIRPKVGQLGHVYYTVYSVYSVYSVRCVKVQKCGQSSKSLTHHTETMKASTLCLQTTLTSLHSVRSTGDSQIIFLLDDQNIFFQRNITLYKYPVSYVKVINYLCYQNFLQVSEQHSAF